jgi:ATP-dependent Clp protease ATP-binding subunit ClpC
MSEYQEKFSISRMVGAPPGYVGYEKGGSDFSEKVRRKPYSVVLLDEIEKAHPDVFNVLLQVLDEGHLTDSLGRKVNFKNTVLIMTSNIGVKELAQRGTSFGFTAGNKEEQENEEQKAFLKKKLKNHFSPEFLNRVDDVILFNSLRKKQLHDIVELSMKDLKDRVNELGFSVELTEAAKDFILNKGYDKEYGARPLNRAIEKYIEDVLAEEMLVGNIPQNSKVVLDVSKDKKSLEVSEVKKE